MTAMWHKMRSVFSSMLPTGEAEVPSDVNHDEYLYPRADGQAMLGEHFLMGAEKFDIVPADNVLFGENADINAIGPQAAHFPFELTQSTEPMRPLQCLINVRRDSVRFVKHEDDTSYCVQFTVDADVACEWRVYYHGHVAHTLSEHRFTVTDATTVVGPEALDVGSSIKCTTVTCPFNPETAPDADESPLQYPIVIELVATDTVSQGTQRTVVQSQLTMCTVNATTDQSGFVLKPVRQKLLSDGVLYLLHDVYGIENKHAGKVEETEAESTPPTDVVDNSMDCVICMSELRDTLIIPCRHLCLCSACAETLSNCPICRSPFRALLHMRTLRKVKSTVSAPNIAAQLIKMASPNKPGENVNINVPNQKSFLTTRYDYVPLVVALNGAVDQTQTFLTSVPTATLESATRQRRRTHAERRRAREEARANIQQVMGAPVATVLFDDVEVAEYDNGLAVVDDDDVSCVSDSGSVGSVSCTQSEESASDEEENDEVSETAATSTPRSGQSADSGTTLIKHEGEARVTQETEC